MRWKPARRRWRSRRCFCLPTTVRSSSAAIWLRAGLTFEPAPAAGTRIVQLSLSRIDLASYVKTQFENLFPDQADLGDLPPLPTLPPDPPHPSLPPVPLTAFST